MNTLKNLSAVCCAFAALTSAAQEWEFLADVPASNHVASGTETLSTRLQIGNDQRFNKTGAGAWNVPQNLLDVFWPVTLKTAAGALQIGVGADAGTDPGATALPASITDKALLWVDAADPQASHIVGSGNEVTHWYDRREGASVASPKYYYAYADPAYSTGGNPVKSTYDGRAGIYFGGVGSLVCMPWFTPSGSRCDNGVYHIRHFFVVTGVTNSWGCIFGAHTGNTSTWVTDTYTCSDLTEHETKYFWIDDYPPPTCARVYVNGERIDILKQSVQRGVQLVDQHPDGTRHYEGGASCFFNDRNIKGRNYGYARDYPGGDYIYEAICFTNLLTETELRQVRAYLMRKWQIAGRREIRVPQAAGAELVADTTSGVATNGANVVGAGTLVKTGANDLYYRNFAGVAFEGSDLGAQNRNTGTRFDGAIDIREGAVAMLSQAPVAVTAGQVLSSAADLGAQLPSVTVASGDAETLVKTGAGDALVNGVPAGVRRLSVEKGVLALRNRPAPELAESEPCEVFVPNHSFEEDPGNLFGDGATNLLKTIRCGWYASGNGNAKLIHFLKWTGDSKVMDNTTRKNWNFFSDAPDGDGIMAIDNNAYAETDVTIPSAGWYEASLFYSAREGYGRHNVFRVQLVRSGTVEVDFGRGLDTYSGGYSTGASPWSFAYPAGYQPYVQRAYVAQPGDYRLRISRQPSMDKNVRMVFDDIHLRRVLEKMPETVAIPGGTFETVSLVTSDMKNDLLQFTNVQTVAGWTFGEAAGYPDAAGPVAGIALPRHKGKRYSNTAEFYNDTRGPGHGFAEAFFRAPTTATTTFTMTTSGTFRVQADLACFRVPGGKMQLTATVNGTACDLGTVVPDTKMMATRQWPVRLALAEGDDVTLVFTFSRTDSNAGLWMDDVCLAAKCLPVEGNLVMNGSFEKGTTSWTCPRGSISQRDTQTTDASQINAFGREVADGRYYMTFTRNSDDPARSTVAYQDVAFPQEGVYSLSFYSHKRLNSGTSVGNTCATKWWLEDTTAKTTNVLIRSANDTNRYTEHTVDFYVSRAGTFRLGISGDPAGKGSTWYDAMIDAVSVTHIGDLEPTDAFTKDLRVEVAAGAKLNVCFAGTNKVGRLVLGGKPVRGVVNSSTHPDYITGTGSFEPVRSPGLAIMVK